jgi:MFS family permease
MMPANHRRQDPFMSGNARLGPIQLAPGILPSHALTYLYVTFAGITLSTFVGAFLPYILNVNLAVPIDQQGGIAGDMGFYREIVLIATSTLIGAMSDRSGRRLIMVAGMFVLSFGYALFGYVDSVTQLIIVQLILALGISLINVMIIAVQVDYADEGSRGKLVGFSGVAIGLGMLLLGVFFTRLPNIYVDNFGVAELTAGQYASATMSTLAFVTALAAWFGLKAGTPPHVTEHLPVRTLFANGLAAGRDNPRILLAYLSAFVSRGDMVVVGTFFMLWLTQAGLAADMSADEATKVAGIRFAIIMATALVWAPILGFINDRMDRTTLMMLSLGIAAVGYIGIGLIPDPLGGLMIPCLIVVGIGQMSVTSACQTLVGQEAPPSARGAITGMFAFFGALGILFITKIGGIMYDGIGPAAPFVLIGFFNAALCVFAVYVRKMPPSAKIVETN